MTRKTWIDDFLERFQHRWETNPQYRAAMSGVLGLVFLISICACVGLVSTGATSVLHAMGIGVTGSDGSNLPSGTGNDQKGVSTFSVTTVTPAQPGDIAYATIPSSGTSIPTATPSPTPTETPTATPCVSNCGGGGGGGNPGTVSGYAQYDGTGKWHANVNVTFVVHTSQPNIGVSVVIDNLPNYGTRLFQPLGTTDASGNFVETFQLSSLGNGTAHATITAGFDPIALGSFDIQCAP